MNLLVIGLNHRSAPVAVRERLAFPKAHLGEATCRLLGDAPLAEAAIISTCNRVEVYALTGDNAVAGSAVRRFLQRRFAVETVTALWEEPSASDLARSERRTSPPPEGCPKGGEGGNPSPAPDPAAPIHPPRPSSDPFDRLRACGSGHPSGGGDHGTQPSGIHRAPSGAEASLESHLYVFEAEDCVRHLLEVVCGLDSMVVGETEILGQVKDAYAAAQAAGATGAALNRLFQKAFAAAKQIRSSTAITRGSTSVGSVAVDLATQIFHDLGSRTVLIIGTGEISEATARALRSRGAGQLLVCSRHAERAAALAGELGGRAISYEQWETEFPAVDIAIAATAAPHPILTPLVVAPLMARRQQRPLFLIDIAVPRNIDRACGDLANVYLYDIDDLQGIAQQNLAARQREVTACRGLIAEHAGRFWSWFAGRDAELQARFAAGPARRTAVPAAEQLCLGRGQPGTEPAAAPSPSPVTRADPSGGGAL